jgi:hypothetical protein
MALRHGLMPLLYRNLKSACQDAVPKAILERLRDQYRANTMRNLLLTGELLKVLNLFEANDIPAIPYKGPTLAASVYGDLALRQFVDLDILVHKRDVRKAKSLLVSRGYQNPYHFSPVQKVAYLQSDSGCLFNRNDSKVIVELEWEITPRGFPFCLDLEPFWERLEWASFEGRRIQAFSPEDLLLVLCMHGAKHCWERLSLACDLAELIRVRNGVDWGRVMERAKTLNCERMFLLGLSLANDLLKVPLPDEVLQKVQVNPMVKSLTSYVRQRLAGEASDPLGAFALSLFYLKVSERFKDRAGYCFRLAFTPTISDWEFLHLPSFLDFLYYLIHPIRLVAKYGLKPLTRIYNGR